MTDNSESKITDEMRQNLLEAIRMASTPKVITERPFFKYNVSECKDGQGEKPLPLPADGKVHALSRAKHRDKTIWALSNIVWGCPQPMELDMLTVCLRTTLRHFKIKARVVQAPDGVLFPRETLDAMVTWANGWLAETKRITGEKEVAGTSEVPESPARYASAAKEFAEEFNHAVLEYELEQKRGR